MNEREDQFTLGQSLEEWVLSKCEDWRDHYETNYEEKHDEYYRLWRGIWDSSDSLRDSERGVIRG
jgi:hypothetical protein